MNAQGVTRLIETYLEPLVERMDAYADSRVDKIGPEVSGIEPGQLVAALTVYGSYSQSICLPSHELIALPAGIDPAEAVCLLLSYVTAYQMLHRMAQVKPGERILVHGAGEGEAA